MSKRTTKIDWKQTEQGRAAYVAARAEAQAKANATGLDHGIEANDVFKTWRVFMLPRRENRYGHELRCEVVSCESLAKCQQGHGPGPLACGWQS